MDFRPPVDFRVESELTRREEEKALNSVTLLADSGLTLAEAQEKDKPKTYDDLNEEEKKFVRENYHSVHEDPPIGDASMDKAETIFLRLRQAGTVFADTNLEYKKGSTHYSNVLEHLGGLKPGEVKLVAPWPDEIDHDSKDKGNKR